MQISIKTKIKAILETRLSSDGQTKMTGREPTGLD